MSETQAIEFTPGTYTAAVKGNGGEVPVVVTFSKDKIENIQVGVNKETPGIGSVAIEQLPAAIVKNQSLAVNAVAGASITSNAILATVAACVNKAGANPDVLQTIPKQAKRAEEKTLNADIAIVGAGAAGQTAAIRASQLGKKVILLEKMPCSGGTAAVNGGTVVIQGSKIQKDSGVKDDSPEIMTEDYIKNGHS